MIQDSGVDGGTGGSLTKEGAGALALTNASTYTGATRVTGGALVVDGSIAASSSVSVEAGGTLAGTGTVSSTAVNAGGTLLAGHGDAPFGALAGPGGVRLRLERVYRPGLAGRCGSDQCAGLRGGARRRHARRRHRGAKFAKGSYVTKHYNILHADGGLNSTTFGNLVEANLAPFLVASLSYGTNDVFLDLKTVDPTSIPGLNVNQRNVARGIVNSINLVGGAPGAFATLADAGEPHAGLGRDRGRQPAGDLRRHGPVHGAIRFLAWLSWSCSSRGSSTRRDEPALLWSTRWAYTLTRWRPRSCS